MAENQNPNPIPGVNPFRNKPPLAAAAVPEAGRISNEVNLLEQVRVEKLPKPKGFYWLIGLDVLIVASALATGYSFKPFFESGAIYPLLASAGLLVGLSCLEVLLIGDLKRRFLVLLLEAAALILFFYRESSLSLGFSAAVGGAVLLIVGFGEILSRTESLNSIKIRFFRITTPLAKRTTTALSLLFVLFYLPQLGTGGPLISKGLFESLINWSAAAIESFYPEFNLHSSVKDFSVTLAGYQLAQNNTWKAVPPSTKKQILDQTAGQIMAALNSYSGMNLSGRESLSDVVYGFLTRILERWQVEFGNWFLFAWLALIFLLVRSAGVVFWWLAVFLAFAVYELLLGLNLIHIHGESVMRETIEFS